MVNLVVLPSSGCMANLQSGLIRCGPLILGKGQPMKELGKKLVNSCLAPFGLEMRKVKDRNGQVLLSDAATRTELQRLLYRSSKTYGCEKTKAVKDFIEVVDSLRHVSYDISNFLSLLDICDFFRRETIRG